MPNTKFLENYPLYKKFTYTVPYVWHQVPKPPIHVYCEFCKSDQTFNISKTYSLELQVARNAEPAGQIIRIVYICESCKEYQRFFLLEFDLNQKYIQKVGQYPPFEISIDKNISKMLGTYKNIYKKGLICESQGYGIGSYAYYRRIVEDIIDKLLNSIKDLLDEKAKEKYCQALDETKKTTRVVDKIELIKDLLPPILKPNNINPLNILYKTLSEGIHQKTDEECLEIAENIKDSLIFLINQIIQSKEASNDFTEKMKKLLEDKSKK